MFVAFCSRINSRLGVNGMSGGELELDGMAPGCRGGEEAEWVSGSSKGKLRDVNQEQMFFTRGVHDASLPFASLT